MLICLEYHPQAIYRAFACNTIKKDRRYFQEAFRELHQARLLICQNKKYFTIPATIVRKLSEGIRNPFKKSLENPQLADSFLTFTEKYYLHAFRAICFHSLPEHIWEKYRGHGSWEAENYPNLKRFVFDPSYTYFENEHYTVKMYKKKLEIYGPSVSCKDSNDRQYKFLTAAKLGRFVEWLAEKMSAGKLQIKIDVERIRFHETNRTDLFQGIANKFYEEGSEQIIHQHWMYDESKGLPEWEANQGYFQVGGIGDGPNMVDEVLEFPRLFVKRFLPHYEQQQQQLQQNLDKQRIEQESVNVEVVKHLKLLNVNLEKGNRILENVSVFQDNLATKEDIELVQESLQRLKLELEKQTIKVLHVVLDNKCQKILNKLAEGSQTRSELALFLGVSDTAPLTQIRKLLAAGEIEEIKIETGKRGRPKKKYKVVEK